MTFGFHRRAFAIVAPNKNVPQKGQLGAGGHEPGRLFGRLIGWELASEWYSLLVGFARFIEG